MKMKAKVILNEQHSLLPEQEGILDKKFENGWEIVPVPASGWTLAEMDEIYEEYKVDHTIVFASPIPYLIQKFSYFMGYGYGEGWNPDFQEGRKPTSVYIFHNDRREKKELPNGKIVHTVAKEGWQLV